MRKKTNKGRRDQGPKRRPQRNTRPANKPKGSDHHFFIAGMNGVVECLASPHIEVEQLYVQRSKLPKDQRLHMLLNLHTHYMQEVKTSLTPDGELLQGLGVRIKRPNWGDFDTYAASLGDMCDKPLLVILDQVEDPQNLGQMLRTCECAGVDGLLVPRHRSVHLNETVARVSQGAFAWVPVIEIGNMVETFKQLKQMGIWVIGVENHERAQSWYSWDYTAPVALVLGSEGRGMRPLSVKHCDMLVSLPMRGHLNSLNVGSACSALLFEVLRQRGYHQKRINQIDQEFSHGNNGI